MYRVRDNGSVCRQWRPNERKRPLDGTWTFGWANASTGYMQIGAVVVHRIVATAFHGEQPSEKHIVDHIDTNRRNNRSENLRWITRLDNLLQNPITRRRIEFAWNAHNRQERLVVHRLIAAADVVLGRAFLGQCAGAAWSIGPRALANLQRDCLRWKW